MSSFDRIVIIFNPQSTGNAPESAAELGPSWRGVCPPCRWSSRRPTMPGTPATSPGRPPAAGCPLIVSVSGDGGYNEVVNGVMDAGNDRAVSAVRAAGNANDHRRVTREQPLADAIVAGDVRRIDLLRLTVGSGPDAEIRYAHSYIGVGLTPVVAVDLEKGGKGSWREIVSVVRAFSRFRPFPIRLENGRRRSIDSLVFANIAEMAKYAMLSEDGAPGRRPVRGDHPAADRQATGPGDRAPGGDAGARPAADRHPLRLHDARAHAAAAGRRARGARRGHAGRRRHRPAGAGHDLLIGASSRASDRQPSGSASP